MTGMEVQNIIVEVCFDNGTSNWTDSDPVRSSFTNFNSVQFDQDDFGTGCALPTPDVSNLRPNLLFVMCTYPPSGITLQWTPGAGLFDPVTGAPCDSCNPVDAIVFEDTEFTLDAWDGECFGDSSITVRIDSSFYIAAQTDTALCFNDSVPLQAIVLGTPPSTIFTCGANFSPCFGNPNFLTAQIGTATTNTGSDPLEFSIYNGAFSDAKTQMLFRASELAAQGMVAGTITDITFFVSAVNTILPFDNFTISMGCTSSDNLNGGFETSLVTVFGPATYAPILGPNLHTLGPGFDWDGVSNIVVEVCFDNLQQQFLMMI